MSKSKVVCAAGSAGLSILTLLVYTVTLMGLVVFCFARDWNADPAWVFWLDILVMSVTVPAALMWLYRMYFQKCYRPEQS